MERKELIQKAFEAQKFSYSPYSHFAVGAALLTSNGTVYTGCNIENASFGATNCAERTAVFKAVSEGKREFAELVLVGGSPEKKQYLTPCGICRQVLAEFCNGDFPIVSARTEEDYRVFLLRELLPEGFGAEDMEK